MMRKSNLTLALLLSLGAGAKAYGAIGAEVPLANTDIGNQAYVSYFTENNTQKFLQSNIVITRINPVYNLALTPDRITSIAKGSTAVFNHTLVNTGNVKDSYDLRHDYTGPRKVEIYLDKNNNGTIDAGETKLVADANGKYQIKDLEPGDRVSLLVAVQTLAGDDVDLGVTGKIYADSKDSAIPEVSVNETIKFQVGGNAIV
ncbi:MAG: hypothetical protein ACRC4S_01310, partial [Cetobacterium sp.]